MCYLPPGPRCSNHASEALRKAEQAYFNASDIHSKMRLWNSLEEARSEYYSTPRGQNELLLEIALLVNSPDRNKEMESKLTDLRIKARKGQILRASQLEAYSKVKVSKKTKIRETLETSSKQDRAVGITYDVLLDEMSDKEPHIKNNLHVQMLEADILVMPTKLQIKVGSYDDHLQNEDEFISLLMRNNCQLNVESSNKAHPWILSVLQRTYTHISMVDVYTEKLKLFPVENLHRYCDFSFKARKRLGGTSNPSSKDMIKLTENLQGTPFEGSSVEQRVVNNQLRTFVLYDKPVTVASDQHLQDFYLKALRTDNEDVFYEARKKHASHKHDVFLVLKRSSPALLSTEIRLPASS